MWLGCLPGMRGDTINPKARLLTFWHVASAVPVKVPSHFKSHRFSTS